MQMVLPCLYRWHGFWWGFVHLYEIGFRVANEAYEMGFGKQDTPTLRGEMRLGGLIGDERPVPEVIAVAMASQRFPSAGRLLQILPEARSRCLPKSVRGSWVGEKRTTLEVVAVF